MSSPSPTADIDYLAYPVLIVDDEPDIIETFRFSFRADFTVFSATGGRAALEIVAAKPIAVLVADQRMPEMHGLEVIRRALEIRPTIVPIISKPPTASEPNSNPTTIGAITTSRLGQIIFLRAALVLISIHLE